MIRHLKWDTEFFGRKIGAIARSGSEEELSVVLQDALHQGYEYLTCRVAAEEIQVIRMYERKGFYLSDIGIVLARNTDGIVTPKLFAREGTMDDIEAIKKISSGIFKAGRFYHDPFFSTLEADRFYQTWAENSLKGFADKVFVIGAEGFITCRIIDGKGQMPLVGVSPSSRSRGIGAALVQNALLWFKEKGLQTVKVRTQANNPNAVGFYEHMGFSVKSVDITVGKILNH